MVIKKILSEIDTVLSQIDEEQISCLIKEILSARRIVLVGAGRVGMAKKGFAMRLGHLGLQAHMLGDATVPAIEEKDLLLIGSGSGETSTIVKVAEIAKKNNARIALITGNLESTMAKLSDTVVHLNAPSKIKPVDGFKSIQPMTTLNEQCLSILLDSVVLRLMGEMNETHDTMWARHSNLE